MGRSLKLRFGLSKEFGIALVARWGQGVLVIIGPVQLSLQMDY